MKKEKTLIIIFSLIVMVFLTALTYGFFSAGISNDDKQEVSVTTGDMVLTFADGNAGFDVQLSLGESIEKTFTIENTGSLNTYASISWVDLINTYMEGSLTYTLVYTSIENNNNIFLNTNIVKANKNIPVTDAPLTENLSDAIPIPANKKYYFTLIITFNDIGENQNADLNAVFNSKFKLNAETMYDTIMLGDSGANNETPYLGGPLARNTIESIEMMAGREVSSDAIGSWDVSYYQNKSVIAWYKDIDSNGLYELYIGQDGGVKANPNSKLLFNRLINLKNINLTNYDTTNVYDIGSMFQHCRNLESLDLSNFNTNSINGMGNLFSTIKTEGLMKLKNINFGEKWDTSNVINMQGIFQNCAYLENLDAISIWDTSSVISMTAMFSGAESILNLDLKNWDTSKVVYTSSMFYYTKALKDLKLNNANFNNVTSYDYMFKNSGIESITINPISQSFINNRLTEAGLTPTITLVQ